MIMRTIKLHITINVMTLLDNDEIARATKLLDDCLEKVIMQVDQYVFLNISQSILIFVCILVPQKMNSVQLQWKCRAWGFLIIMRTPRKWMFYSVESNPIQCSKSPMEIWTTSLLEKYGDYDFGCQEVTEILLCAISEKDDEGFYKKIASVKF